VAAGTSVAAFDYTESESGSRTVTATGIGDAAPLGFDTHEISMTDPR